MQSIDPNTGEVIATYEEHSLEKAQRMLETAATAQASWAHVSFSERAEVLRRAAVLLRRDKDRHAALMAREMGKPLEQGRAEVEKCATCCDFFAEHAEGFLRKESIRTDATRSYVLFQPLGVLLAIMPWNFPFWQVIRAVAPSLMAGNAVALKHASNVTGCALATEAVFRQAGLPDGLFQSLIIPSRHVAELIAHPDVACVTLTGSTEAGKSVAAAAGAHLKKTVLELGGSDPYVVLEDADLPAAAETCAASRLINSGQSCIAAKRFIVMHTVREEFERLLVERLSARKLGNPMDTDTQIGPLARHDLRATLQEQVERSVVAGAKLLLGGTIPDGPGAHYPATVLTHVRPGVAAFDEETFGPVAAVVEANSEVEAVALANRSVFGLGAAVFTRSPKRGERVAAQLEAGCCFVNDFVRSDPRLPFGGIKASGYGRELSAFGIREFVNIKTVYLK